MSYGGNRKAMISSKVTPEVFMIDTVAIGDEKTIAVYVVKGSNKVALIDSGHASSFQNVLLGLRELNVAPSEVDYLIPTHVHLDHAGGTGHLLRTMPNASVVAHERAISHLVDPSKLIESVTKVFGGELIRMYGNPVPVNKDRTIAVGKEYHIELGGESLTIIHAPGHAPHQISVFVEKSGLLMSADAVGIVYPAVSTMIPTTPPPSLDPDKLRQTVAKLGHLDAKQILAPHYGVRSDVDKVLENTSTKTNDWIEKVRRMRDMDLSLNAMTDELVKEAALESKIRKEEFPQYAAIAIRVSVMGILHYFNRNST